MAGGGEIGCGGVGVGVGVSSEGLKLVFLLAFGFEGKGGIELGISLGGPLLFFFFFFFWRYSRIIMSVGAGALRKKMRFLGLRTVCRVL